MKISDLLKLPLSWQMLAVCCLYFQMLILPAYADTIRGVVMSEKGEAISGALVMVKGSEKGAITDQKGQFSIEVFKQDVLLVSMVSYYNEEVTIWFVEDVKITLREKRVPNAVLTDYDEQEIISVSSAISTFNAETSNYKASANIIQGLQGKVAGIQTGNPANWEGTSNTYIRGLASFRDNQPLYVLDGLPIDGESLASLNPDDIVSIQLLKDGAACSIFGMRAMNGVVLINSKKGTNEKLQFRYHASAGIQTVPVWDQLITDPSDYSELVWQAYENAGSAVNAASPYSFGRGKIPTYLYDESYQSYPAGRDTDESLYSFPDQLIMKSSLSGTNWWNEVFDPALLTNHHISLSTATENADLFMSAGYYKQEGNMKHTSFERISLRTNSTLRLGRLTFSENLTISGIDRLSAPRGSVPTDNIMADINRAQSILPVYDISGVHFAGSKAVGLGTGNNPLARLYRNKDNNANIWRLLGNVSAEVKLARGLSARTQFGLNLSQSYQGIFSYPNYEVREPNTTHDWQENWSRGLDWTWTNLLLYQRDFGKNHKLHAVLGYEAIKTKNRIIRGAMSDYLSTNRAAWYLNQDLTAPGSASVQSEGLIHSLLGSFGKLDYMFDEKYMVSLSIRRDASSIFGKGNQGVFPAYSMGWRVSEEPFLKKADWIEDMKLRYSWGKTASLAALSAPQVTQFSGGAAYSYYDLSGQNNALVAGYAPSLAANPAARWEESVSSNIGLDASLFGGTWNIHLDIYKQTSNGLLVNAQRSGLWGTAASPWINAGQMENKGIDLTVNYQKKLSDFLAFDITLTASKYVNQILETDGTSGSLFEVYTHHATGPMIINQPGHPAGSFFGYYADGIFRTEEEIYSHASQAGARLGGIRFRDMNEDGQIDENDKGVIGNPHPDAILGLNPAVKIGRLQLSAILFASVGNEVFNFLKLYNIFRYGDANVSKDLLNNAFHPQLNPEGNLPMPDDSDIFSRVSSSFYVEDGSYLRIQNARVSYHLPEFAVKRLRVNQLKIYLQAQNLLTHTKYTGPEPEITLIPGSANLNMDYGTLPVPRTFLLGIEMGF